MILKNYPDPEHCPEWATVLLRYQQNNKMSHSPGFDAEAQAAKELYDAENCDVLIDLGSWIGVLSYKFKKIVNPETLYILDAVPLYLRMTRNLFLREKIEGNVFLEEMCVVPDPEKFNNRFEINISDSIQTSTILPQPDLKNKIIVSIPTTQAITPFNAGIKLSSLYKNSGYLKLDIDGMDCSLVNTILDLPIQPKVIHFEGLIDKDKRREEFKTTLKKLKEHGFSVPNESTVFDSGFIMIVLISSKSQWRLLTYTLIDGMIIYDTVISSSVHG
jgi:hypothetical protein